MYVSERLHALKRGVIFGQSQFTGRMLEVSDWVKLDFRTGARVGVQDLRIKAGIWSDPMALFESSVVSSF